MLKLYDESKIIKKKLLEIKEIGSLAASRVGRTESLQPKTFL